MTPKNFSHIIPPTDAEDAAITAVALSDPDNPPLTDEQLARMRPMTDVMPDLVAALTRPGRPRKDRPKIALSLRLDPDLVAAMRRSGPGWQARVNAELRRTYGLQEIEATAKKETAG